ncbi:MAG: hypothetical protein WCP12_13580 [bacterium]
MKTSVSIVLLAVVTVAMLCVCGCKTSSLSNLNAIPILEGITDAAALDAVAAASDTSLAQNRRLPRGPIQSYEDGVWTVEDRNASSIVVAYSLGRINVTVRYTVEGRTLVPSVMSAQNVRQSESRIHKNVIAWINRHAAEIKSAMWKIKSRAEDSKNGGTR